ncbi:GNAT family N-acetyltransferase [Noviherbaspirillum pedocola]|uniref:GNAT family N-acetyltransferase n=1 Tax=Noviherbaspirillum pedocola TaxID=2801341 RepID=A0A934SVK0_9BURK|nr:GNAT family N-acetyltransferase [Noviherbaspirillum pedocola]MBK4735936.1 GNAT family N-acetyltransferase [Noviherbaspirillum pedocola]
MPLIRTSRLTLRPVVAGDAPALLTIHDHPTYLRYAGGDAIGTITDARVLIASMARDNTSGAGIAAAILLNGQTIGFIEMARVRCGFRPCREWSLGYGLDRRYWRCGYMREALHAMLPFAQALGAHRIRAEVRPENYPSSRLLTELGFEMEGTLRSKGHWAGQFHDLCLFVLVADDSQDRPRAQAAAA